MSTATDKLESGRLALVGFFGESLTWIPFSSLVQSESGQVITTEGGKALVADESEAVEFEANFDEAYQVMNGMEVVSTGPAATDVKASDLPDADRGDLILRGGVQYSVTEIQRDGLGSMTLILSKHAH